MQQKLSFKLLPHEAANETVVKEHVAKAAGIQPVSVTGYHIHKQSIDARGKTIWINLTVNAFINEPFVHRSTQHFNFRDVSNATTKVIIVGAGPAGLFAALQLVEL